MKQVTQELAAHLVQEVTTLCRALKIVRKDGTVERYTDFDQDFLCSDGGPTSWQPFGPSPAPAAPWWFTKNDTITYQSFTPDADASIVYNAPATPWAASQTFGGFGSHPNADFLGNPFYTKDYSFTTAISVHADASGAAGSIRIGLSNGILWGGTDQYVGFQVTKTNGGALSNWFLRRSDGTTAVSVDSGIACVDAARTRLKIAVSADGSQVSWYINGAFAGIETTNIPTLPIGLSLSFQSATFTGSLFFRMEALNVDARINQGSGIYKSADGLEFSAVEHKSDGSTNNLQATGFLSSAGISDTNVRARFYDGATFELRTVNWADLSQGDMKMLSGSVGDIRPVNGRFEMQLRGLTQKLTTQIGSKYGQVCRAGLFGGGAEGIDPANHWKCRLNRADWVQTGTLLESPDLLTLVPSPSTALLMIGSSTPSTAAPAGWFDDGIIKFTSGVLSGMFFEVSTWDGTTLYLFGGAPLPFAPEAGDTFEIEPGCAKIISVCHSKFNNVVNFAGESNIPGLNVLSVIGRPQVQTQ